MKFSERKGYKEFQKIMQFESVDKDLRVSLWNVLDLGVFHSELLKQGGYDNPVSDRFENIFVKFWVDYYKKPFDILPSDPWKMYLELRRDFSSCEWYEVFDLIEEILKLLGEGTDFEFGIDTIETALNNKLEKENSAYRFINGIACEIIDKQEIEQVEIALEDDDFPQVKTHLSRALELLSDKQNPDYRNSIKESISAVENIARLLSGKDKATLGEALIDLEKKGKLQKSLKNGFSNIYGYTSDKDGIRHALMEESNLEKSDAQLFFLLCTVFINYLKTKF
ncbi:MAG: AbiJ-NTD4 domain-containing protein [Anaerolineaceae bacterium]